MAKIEFIIAKLPSLITDRADSLKVETAVRYLGDVIFDASQNRSGDKARWLAGILSRATSPEEDQSRQAIFTLFRDGYLDRYAEYSAWKDIASAAGISDPAHTAILNPEPANVDAPKILSLTKNLNAPIASIDVAIDEPNHIGSVNAIKASAPYPRENQAVLMQKPPNETSSNEVASKPFRDSKSYSADLSRVKRGDEATDSTKRSTTFLEIRSLESRDRSPLEFATKLKMNAADTFSAREFPCLIGFKPTISSDSSSVKWINPLTGDSFVDHGDRLTSGSTGRLAIRAMLELGRADSWDKVAVKGSLRLQGFIEATAAELDRQTPLVSNRRSPDRLLHQSPGLRRLIGTSVFLTILGGLGFGVIQIYIKSRLQAPSLRNPSRSQQRHGKPSQVDLFSSDRIRFHRSDRIRFPRSAVTAIPDASDLPRVDQNGGRYRIQLESTFDRSQAQTVMQRLQRLGYKPKLIASREGDQTSYRIDIGRFAGKDDADAVEDELQRRYDAALAVEYPAGVNSARWMERPSIPVVSMVHKPAPTPYVTPPGQIATAYGSSKGGGIEFSAEPERQNEVSNPKVYGSASYYNRGNAYFAANNFDAASDQFQKAVDLDPSNADAYYAWGLTLYAKHDLQGSIANFRKATRLKPDYPDAYYNWGLALGGLQEFSAAIPKFAKAVEQRTSYADAYYGWARALSRTGDLDGAMDKFQHATSLKPEYADAYYAWAFDLYRQHRLDESIEKYRRALQINPTNQTYKIALGSALTAQRNSSAIPQK